MHFSYNWLKDLSKTKKSPQELAEMVMLKGFELEESFNLADQFKKFVVGEVKDVQKHPDADRLNITKVDLGEHGDDIQIVCGAPNTKVGQKVPVAMPGSILPNSKMEIKKTEVRGIESNGMICAEDEIGLGKDHDGIMVLSNSLEAGTALSKALKLEDTILDFDILPNRAHDCLSYQGIAREIAAMEGRKIDLKDDLKNNYSENGKLLNIEIEDKKLCPRYMGAVLKNIELRESPDWMKARLVASGMEPINNVVDITNYVMLETGSPLHAFDFDEVAQNDRVNILVRKAQKEEKLELLSDDNLKLNQEDLLITNGETPLALAGIKGGKKSGINQQTKQIVLEAANFNSLTIRKSRQRHALTTESQARFEKGISPFLAEVALERAVELLKECAGADLVEIVDCNKLNINFQEIEFDIKKQNKLLGENIDENEALEILKNLGFKIKNKDNKRFLIKVPYWRLDIEGHFDFSEEIGRIKGYEKVKAKPLMISAQPGKRNLLREFEWKVKDNLSAVGFDEIVSYSFYGNREVEVGGIFGDHFELENPNNENQNLMRKTILPGVIQASQLNQKSFDEFGLFEIGRVYFPEKELSEELRLTGAYYNNSSEIKDNFYQAKGKIESFLEKIFKTKVTFQAKEKMDNGFYHPSRSAKILIKGDEIGSLGEINPKIVIKNKIKKPFIVFEFDFEKLFKIKKRKSVFQEIQKFPMVQRDLAIYVKKRTEVEEVKNLIEKAGEKILKRLELFDVFENKEEDKKSLAFHLSFGKENETLQGSEVDRKIEEISQVLEEKNYQIRKA